MYVEGTLCQAREIWTSEGLKTCIDYYYLSPIPIPRCWFVYLPQVITEWFVFIIIFSFMNREVGLIVTQIVDVTEFTVTIDEKTYIQPGIIGSAIIFDQITLFIDLYVIVTKLMPEWIDQKKEYTKEIF